MSKPAVFEVAIDAIRPDPNNARRHPERNLSALAASFRRFGQQKPVVVDQEGVIIAGSGWWMAMKAAGAKKIIISRSALTGPERTAYAIADNKTAELSEWDYEILAAQFSALDEEMREATGFADYEIEPLLQGSWTPPAIAELEPPEHTHAVHFDEDQHQRIVKAIEALDLKLGDSSHSKAESIALICDAYVAG